MILFSNCWDHSYSPNLRRMNHFKCDLQNVQISCVSVFQITTECPIICHAHHLTNRLLNLRGAVGISILKYCPVLKWSKVLQLIWLIFKWQLENRQKSCLGHFFPVFRLHSKTLYVLPFEKQTCLQMVGWYAIEN